MQGIIAFTKILVFTILACCALNTLLMELNIVPKQASASSGVDIVEPQPTGLDPNRKDVMYGDFWMTNDKQRYVNGYCTSVDNTKGNYQIEFPMAGF